MFKIIGKGIEALADVPNAIAEGYKQSQEKSLNKENKKLLKKIETTQQLLDSLEKDAKDRKLYLVEQIQKEKLQKKLKKLIKEYKKL
jgi:flagellar motility protein MotE (MotC chaperone)